MVELKEKFHKDSLYVYNTSIATRSFKRNEHISTKVIRYKNSRFKVVGYRIAHSMPFAKTTDITYLLEYVDEFDESLLLLMKMGIEESSYLDVSSKPERLSTGYAEILRTNTAHMSTWNMEEKVDERVIELAKDICSPVMHMMPEEEYEKWFEAVVQRLKRELGEQQ